MRPRRLTAILVIAALALTPVLPVFDGGTGGAALAKNDKGGGNGGGNGGGKSDSKGGKSGESAAKSSKNAEAASEAGKMNGALNASIGAVMAHVRKGQTRNGPVGLLAGLAVADARASQAAGNLAALQELDRNFGVLDNGLAAAGFGSVEEYLVIRSSGILTEDEMAVIDPLIAAVGGTTRDGAALVNDRPRAQDLQAAEDRVAGASDAVETAETAIARAMNREDDVAGMLAAMRKKLAPYKDRIASAID